MKVFVIVLFCLMAIGCSAMPKKDRRGLASFINENELYWNADGETSAPERLERDPEESVRFFDRLIPQAFRFL